jgi:hypothetical protein
VSINFLKKTFDHFFLNYLNVNNIKNKTLCIFSFYFNWDGRLNERIKKT